MLRYCGGGREYIRLGHQCHVSPQRGSPYPAAVEIHVALAEVRRRQAARNGLKEGRFPCATGADKDHEFSAGSTDGS